MEEKEQILSPEKKQVTEASKPSRIIDRLPAALLLCSLLVGIMVKGSKRSESRHDAGLLLASSGLSRMFYEY